MARDHTDSDGVAGEHDASREEPYGNRPHPGHGTHSVARSDASLATSGALSASPAGMKLELSAARRAELLSRSRERLAQKRRSELEQEEALTKLQQRVRDLNIEVDIAQERVADADFERQLSDEITQWLRHMDPVGTQRAADDEERKKLELQETLSNAAGKAARSEARLITCLERFKQQRATVLEAQCIAEHMRQLAEEETSLRSQSLMLEEELRVLGGAAAVEGYEQQLHSLDANIQRLQFEEREARDDIELNLEEFDRAIGALHQKRTAFSQFIAQRNSRWAFERRVRADRRARAEAELERLNRDIAQLEAELEYRAQLKQQATLAEEAAVLEQMLANYRCEVEAARKELAVTPTAAELPERRRALEAQVFRLSVELAHALDDSVCALLGDDVESAKDREEQLALLDKEIRQLSDECKEIEQRCAAIESDTRQDEECVALWEHKELVQHLEFERRLQQEYDEMMNALVVMQQQQQHAENTSAPDVDAAAAEEDSGGSPAASPGRRFEVVFLDVPPDGEEGTVKTRIEQRKRPLLGQSERSTAAPEPPPAEGMRVKDVPHRFNFITVTVVTTVLRMLGWDGDRVEHSAFYL